MNDSKKKLTEEELKLIEETERFMEEVNSDPEVADLTAPSEMRENIFAKIHARETEAHVAETESKDKKRTAEEQELIRLGRIYKKRRRAKKYLVVAAAVICAMAFGITSMGGPKKIFGRVESALSGRKQINFDSDEIETTTIISEGKIYQEIEDTFGFMPVGLNYLPENVELLRAEILDELQGASMIYGNENEAKIRYLIRPNYRTSSWGEDIEDKLLEEYTRENGYATIYVRKYLIEEKQERWMIQFEYKDVSYMIQIFDTPEEEVAEIIENIYFL